MLDKIRNAPRATRQRWFVGITILAAVVLVFLWVQYLSWSFRSANADTANETNSGFGPTQTLKGLGASFYDALHGSKVGVNTNGTPTTQPAQ